MHVTVQFDGGHSIQVEPLMNLLQAFGQLFAATSDVVGFRGLNSGQIYDFRTPCAQVSEPLKPLKIQDSDAREILWHSGAHLMAHALKRLWPQCQLATGPATSEGFYYDVWLPVTLSVNDLPTIEQVMMDIQKADYAIDRESWPIEKAFEYFESRSEPFKVEILRDLQQRGVTHVWVYRQGDFLDLCEGPHVQSTGQLRFFKLLSVAGAYWRSDENNPMLQRIYGTVFYDKKDLDDYLNWRQEALSRDHRHLGKEMGLFFVHPLSAGNPFFTPEGTQIYLKLQEFLRELYRQHGYLEIITPQIFDSQLFEISGHWHHYRENMYFWAQDESQKYTALKPMNCPSHCLYFQSRQWSWRQLPLRIADFGRLHRNERAGTMHGLARVRSFSQDDAHIFCRPDQLQSEIQAYMNLLKEVYSVLGLRQWQVFLSTRPAQRMGSESLWDMAENSLRQALADMGLSFQENPGEGAFYGPKLDIMVVDALKRPWQLGTLQVDFNLPEAFDLCYIGADNKKHRVVMLHRAILGSLERFIAVYLEHTAGHLPAWLHPWPVAILMVSDKVQDYVQNICQELQAQGLWVHLGSPDEKLAAQVRQAQLKRIPFMIIVGEREKQNDQITIRLNHGRNVGPWSRQSGIDAIIRFIRQRRWNPDELVTIYESKGG